MQTFQPNLRLPRPAEQPAIWPARFGKWLSVLLVASTACIRPASGAQPMTCGELAALSLPNTKITSTTVVPAGPFTAVSIGDPYAAEGTTSAAPTCSSNIAAAPDFWTAG